MLKTLDQRCTNAMETFCVYWETLSSTCTYFFHFAPTQYKFSSNVLFSLYTRLRSHPPSQGHTVYYRCLINHTTTFILSTIRPRCFLCVFHYSHDYVYIIHHKATLFFLSVFHYSHDYVYIIHHKATLFFICVSLLTRLRLYYPP